MIKSGTYVPDVPLPVETPQEKFFLEHQDFSYPSDSRHRVGAVAFIVIVQAEIPPPLTKCQYQTVADLATVDDNSPYHMDRVHFVHCFQDR